jgi:hypothetical protein
MLFVLISRLNAEYFIFLSLCGIFVFLSWCGVYLFQVEKSSSIYCRSNQLFWCHQQTLQIQRHGYFRHFYILKYVDLYNLSFHAINMNITSLFSDSSFLFLTILNMYFIVVLYQFKWMNIVYSVKNYSYEWIK